MDTNRLAIHLKLKDRVGSDEAEVAGWHYANNLTAGTAVNLQIVKCLWLGAKPFQKIPSLMNNGD